VTGFIAIEPVAVHGHPAHGRADATEISMLFVHASTQREGIGTALLRNSSPSLARSRFREFKSGPEPTTRRPQQFYAASR